MEQLDSCGGRLARGAARSATIVCLTAGVLLAAATPSGDPVSQDAHVTSDQPSSDSPRIPGPAGYRVYLDENGSPVAPPPVASPVAASVVAAPSEVAPTPEHRQPLVEVDAPGGGKMIVLDDRFHMYSVASIASDKTLSIDCARTPHTRGMTHEEPAASACTVDDAHRVHDFRPGHRNPSRHETAGPVAHGHGNAP